MVAGNYPALQHDAAIRTPRPLPLFLDMVRNMAVHNPDLAIDALAGMRVYGLADRPAKRERMIVAQQGRVTLRCAREGGLARLPTVVLVPSLINSSAVLDLGSRSLLEWLAEQGFDALLLDWGVPTSADREEDLGDHVALLVNLVESLQRPVHLVGYCLGGTMAMAAAALHPFLSLTLLATPWHFDQYPGTARLQLGNLWRDQEVTIDAMGLMPIELLQTAFWGLDPERTVKKFAALAGRSADDPVVRNFAAVEDWANDGAPLTASAGRDLFRLLISEDRTGKDEWRVRGQQIRPSRLALPVRHFTAADDRIAPAATAPKGIDTVACPSGHVGMMTGSRARQGCWEPLATWLRSSDVHGR